MPTKETELKSTETKKVEQASSKEAPVKDIRSYLERRFNEIMSVMKDSTNVWDRYDARCKAEVYQEIYREL